MLKAKTHKEKYFRRKMSPVGQNNLRILSSMMHIRTTWYCTTITVLYCWHVGYDENINPSVTNVLATAAFRFGHTLVQGFLTGRDASYNVLGGTPLSTVRQLIC